MTNTLCQKYTALEILNYCSNYSYINQTDKLEETAMYTEPPCIYYQWHICIKR